MEELEFCLEITGDRSGYRIRAASPYRDAITTGFTLPWDDAAMDEQLYRVENAVLRGSGRRRSKGASEEALIREFGTALFDAVFPDDVREAFYDAVENARASNSLLRLKLDAGPAEVARLPWEFLYDVRTPDFVVLSKTTPLVRHLSVGKPTPDLTVVAPLRILAMTCSPTGMQQLDVEEEKRRISEAVQPLVDRGQIDLVWIEGQTWRDLQAAMENGPWHVFHFIGHGHFDDAADEGLLALTDDAGMFYGLRSQQLARLIGEDSTLRLVVLNACEGARGDDSKPFSSMAATLVQRGIPAVLAMQYEVSDIAAMEFSRKLYGSLAAARPLDVAVADARLAVSFAVNDSFEWATPVLFMRAIDGALFNIDASSPMPSEPLSDLTPPPEPQAPPGADAEAPIAFLSAAEPPAQTSTPIDVPMGADAAKGIAKPDIVEPPLDVEADAATTTPESGETVRPAAPAEPTATGSSSGGVWKGVAIAVAVFIVIIVAAVLMDGTGSSESSLDDFLAGDDVTVVTDNVVRGELVRGQESVLFEYRAPEGASVVDVAVLPADRLDVKLSVLQGSIEQAVDDEDEGGRESLPGMRVGDDGSLYVRVKEFAAGSPDGGFTITFQPLG